MSRLSRVLYKKSQGLIEEGKYEQAIVYLLNAIEDDPKFLEGYLDLAYCCAMIDDFDEAEDYCNRALEIDSRNVDALLTLAFIYHKFGFYDDEIDVLTDLLKSGIYDDLKVEVYLGLGNAYYEKNEPRVAIDYYKKVVDLDPENIEAYVNLGNAYFSEEEFNKSVESYKMALQLSPDDSNIYSNLGVAYIEMGEIEKAHKYLEESIRLDPANESAIYNLGILFAINNNGEKAMEQYRKLIELNSDMAGSLLKILELKDKFLI